MDTMCDLCGDRSNSEPDLPCGRVDEPGAEPCAGTYKTPRYYAVPAVIVVEATSADQATDLATPTTENELSDDGESYLGMVYAGKGCPITPAMAGDPDWDALVFYHASRDDIEVGRAMPLVEDDDDAW